MITKESKRLFGSSAASNCNSLDYYIQFFTGIAPIDRE